MQIKIRVCSSVGERFLDAEEAVGSIPTRPTTLSNENRGVVSPRGFFCFDKKCKRFHKIFGVSNVMKYCTILTIMVQYFQ